MADKNVNTDKTNSEKVLKTAEDVVVGVGKIPEEAVRAAYEAEKGGMKVMEDVAHAASEIPPAKQMKKFWYGLGPGLTTGAADDDPSGIATYSQTGAKYGFQLLWVALITFPLMAVIQEMCARIGLQTGRGLAHNIKHNFAPWVIYFVAVLVLAANSFNIGADLGALAEVTKLIWPGLSYPLLVISFTLFCLLLQIFIPYGKYARYLKYLALILLVYVITAFVIQGFPWLEAVKHLFTPSLTASKEQIILVCALFGTTISPYLFFWQTSQEVEEKIEEGMTQTQIADTAITAKAIKKMRLDVWIGMFISNLAMFFIIAVCGATLFKGGINNVNTAADAALALQPLAGDKAFLLFALGIFGVGLLGIPVLAGSASYAVSECFGQKVGLHNKFGQAKVFYGIIIFSMLIGLVINFIGLDPIKALIYAAVFNGLVVPIVLVLIVKLSSNKNVMKERINRPFTTFIGWLTAIMMIIVGLATIYALF